MIPYSDPSEPNRIFPFVNIGLIIANFIVFFYELSIESLGTTPFNHFINAYALVPCEYTARCNPAHFGTPQPFELTMLSSMFLHAGWLHILGNMLFLWVFGDNVENSMGHIRYLIFYLLCGIAANALEIATSVNSTIPGLGASGAIAGVLGAYLVLYPGSRIGTLIPITFILIPVRLPAWVLIGFWFVLQFLNGLVSISSHAGQATGGVAYWAHVGGFTAGILLVWVFRKRDRVSQMRSYHAQRYGGGWTS